MHKSVRYWLIAKYKANTPEIAQDALPADELRRAFRKLSRRWQKRFDEAAEELAAHFAKAAHARSDASLRAILKRSGFAIPFTMSRAMRDIVKATVYENVSLIKSIPRQYLKDVEGDVMRSVQTGRNVGGLSKALQRHYGVTQRRAELIARDQNNKATSAFTRARQQELGIQRAIWRHSAAGKEPRPTHVKMNGKKYNVAKGMWDPDADGKGKGRYIWPGELINCRCVPIAIIPGVNDK